MASKNKKNKAKNSYMYDGGEKIKDGTLKRLYYFTKAQRNKLKDDTEEEYFDYYEDLNNE